jgi:hypothetical protein
MCSLARMCSLTTMALVEKAQSQEGALNGADEDVMAWEVVLEPDVLLMC